MNQMSSSRDVPTSTRVDELRKQARTYDEQDPLKHLRDEFELPPVSAYFCGNSLGPLPKRCRVLLNGQLDKWSRQGVEGHFLNPNPWVSIDEICVSSMARLVGARAEEVAIMNSLTVNIHLLLTSFYNPDGKRNKVVIEKNAFPSDIYAVQSHVHSRGLKAEECVMQVDLGSLEQVIRKDGGKTIALVFVGGVNYQTGEVVNMEQISSLCRSFGITVGYDLAHAVGNVKLELNKWNVDFAAWCTYKYLNSGPGGIAGVFVHSTHHHSKTVRRLEGWWGSKRTSRFLMHSEFTPDRGASAWQLSNPPVFQTVSLRASLDVFDKVTNLDDMFAKSQKMTSFLERCLNAILVPGTFSILTPPPPARGCQLSIVFHGNHQSIDDIHHKISNDLGFICDKRQPNVLRVAPAPLFNRYSEVVEFAVALRSVLLDGPTSPAHKSKI